MSKDEIAELKVYVEGVMGGKVITEQMGYCKKCGKYNDLRFGYCFDCVFEICPLDECPFKRLVYQGYKSKRVWKNYQYKSSVNGKIYCDHPKGLCAKAKNIKLLGAKEKQK